jgi:hypothetical protein
MRALIEILLPACVLSRYGGARRCTAPAVARRRDGTTTKLATEPNNVPDYRFVEG